MTQKAAAINPSDYRYKILADITGLTTGAITSIIDRLEKVGFVRRAKDPDDRRKVIVEPVEEEARRRLGPVFDAFRQEVEALHARYSDEELALVLDYMNRCIGLMRDRTRRLQGAASQETML